MVKPADSSSEVPSPFSIRQELRPGDLGAIVRLHGLVYAREHGFDATFEAYVAGPLAEFVRSPSPRNRLWMVERNGELVGCVAIVGVSEAAAQLRWYLVDPSARGQGLGRWLLQEAVQFARGCGYGSLFLWTVSSLTVAARLYQAVGFRRVEQRPGQCWGVDVVEENYVLNLTEPMRTDG